MVVVVAAATAKTEKQRPSVCLKSQKLTELTLSHLKQLQLWKVVLVVMVETATAAAAAAAAAVAIH